MRAGYLGVHLNQRVTICSISFGIQFFDVLVFPFGIDAGEPLC